MIYISTSSKDGRKEFNMIFKEKQNDLLSSVILGDGCIYKTGGSYSLYIGHGGNQKDYLQWKIDLLNDSGLFDNTLKMKSKIITLKQYNKQYLQYFVTKTWVQFKDIYELFENKRNIVSILKTLKSDRSLAIWFMDDGSVFKKKRKVKNGDIHYDKPTMKLCTHCFTKEENQEIINWFKRRYLIEPKMVSETKRNKTYYYLRFNAPESLKIFKIIKPFVDEIPSMKIKFSFFYEYYKF